MKIIESTATKTAEEAAERAAAKVIDKAVERAVDAVTEKYDPRLQKLETEFGELKKTVLEATAAGSASRQANTSMGSFISGRIEIKGICKFRERQTKGYSKPEVASWLDRLFGKLGSQKEAVDIEATRKLAQSKPLSTSITIKLKGPEDGTAREIADHMNGLFSSDQDLNFRESKIPRAVPEPPPWKKPFINHGGKALGILEESGISGLDPQWGPPAFEAYKAHPSTSRPLLIVRWTQTGGYTLEDQHIRLFDHDFDIEQVRKKLTQ